MVDATLKEVPEVDVVKGLPLPGGVSLRELIITGPPGSGKSTESAALGGWPEEGFLDLTHRRWWRSPVLNFRPREVHLGMPFQGHAGPLTVFDEEWLRTEPAPRLNLSRIFLPPPGKWRSRYVFAFLLPRASRVFEAREERAYRQTHPVDTELSLDQIRAQIHAHRELAHHLHRAGLRVFVRDEYGGPPRVFESEMRGGGSPWIDAGTRARRPWLARVLGTLTGTGSEPVVEQFEEIRLSGDRVRLSVDILPIEIGLGAQKLRIYPDVPLGAAHGSESRDLLVLDPDEYADTISGFVRIAAGGRIRIGRGTEDRLVTPRLPTDATSRLEIAYDGTLLSLVDLHSSDGTIITPLSDPQQVELLRSDVRERLGRLARIYGGAFEQLPADDALAGLREVNRLLETQRIRPPDKRSRPGGLVELPIDVTPVIVGDLHGRLGNLLRVLSANRFLDEMEAGRASVILLGDAIHPEEGDLEDMESSILMMDLIVRLTQAFPEHFVYLRGNHDSFSREVTKGGIPQGRVWRKRLLEVRGEAYVEALKEFYERIPMVAASADFVACHGGPPQKRVSRKRLINLYKHPRVARQLSWIRMQRAGYPGGYTKREVRALQQALGLDASHPLIVSHTPQSGDDTVWLDQGGIRGHHIVYSAKPDRVGLFCRLNGRMVPLVYTTWPGQPWLASSPESSPSYSGIGSPPAR